MKPASVRGASLEGIDAGADDSTTAGPHAPTSFPPDPAAARPRSSGRPALLVVGLVLLLAVPLSVALGVLHQPRWYPIADLAQTELRVRDVGGAHSPLIGLPGRLGSFGSQGSHPGPLSFWSMAPVYRLLGASSWGMQTAAVFLHLVAMAAILGIAYRRGGVRFTLAMAAMLAVLIRVYGTPTLTEAWNPYLPVLWWMVFLLAIWSILCRDLKLLPVAVFAASFCMQTHLPYVGLAGIAFAVTFAVVSFQTWQRRAEPGVVRHFTRWALLAAAVGVLVWLPPVIDQLTSDQGNLSVVWKELTNPPEAPIGVRRGLELLLVHLNPWRLLARQPTATTGALLPGMLLLCAWVASVVVSWRLRHRSLLRLHLVLAGALVLAAVSMTRIHGIVWYYLVLWAWGINALMVLAIGWTARTVAARRAFGGDARPLSESRRSGSSASSSARQPCSRSTPPVPRSPTPSGRGSWASWRGRRSGRCPRAAPAVTSSPGPTRSPSGHRASACSTSSIGVASTSVCPTSRELARPGIACSTRPRPPRRCTSPSGPRSTSGAPMPIRAGLPMSTRAQPHSARSSDGSGARCSASCRRRTSRP